MGNPSVSVSEVVIEVGRFRMKSNREFTLIEDEYDAFSWSTSRQFEIVVNGHMVSSYLTGTKLTIGEYGSLVSNDSSLIGSDQ